MLVKKRFENVHLEDQHGNVSLRFM